MFQMVGVFAELIRERIMAGLVRAKAQGKKLGRKRTETKLERKIERALARGDRGIRKIAREIGVGVGTVQRIKAEMAGDSYASRHHDSSSGTVARQR